MNGYIDRFDSVIAGWAYEPTDPGKALEIVVECDGKELYRCVASLFREDVLAEIGTGEHGFTFEPDENNGFDKNMRLQVYAITNQKNLLFEGFWKYQGVVVEGRDKWLFLNRDSNQVNMRISGEVGIESEKIYKAAITFASRQAMLSQLNIPYVALIVPEKNVVCRENFRGLEVSQARPVMLILDETKKLGCYPIYPIFEFENSQVDLYYKTDTHTNIDGYSLLYRILQKKLPDLFKDVEPNLYLNPIFSGDLGSKFTPGRTEEAMQYVLPNTKEHFYQYNRMPDVFENGGTIRGEIVLAINHNATKRLLVFGSSSAYHALPLLSCAFAQTLFVWENTFDYKIIQEFEPDCVLWLPPERFLPMRADDITGLPETLKVARQII